MYIVILENTDYRQKILKVNAETKRRPPCIILVIARTSFLLGF